MDKNIRNLNKDVNDLNGNKAEVEARQAAEKKQIGRSSHWLHSFILLFCSEEEKDVVIKELEGDLAAKKAENAKYKKAINAAKASVGGLTSALTACKDTLESAM